MNSILEPAVSMLKAALRGSLRHGRTTLLAAAAAGAVCISGCGDNSAGGGGGGLDYEGQKYKTAMINGKRWMAQNMNYNPPDGNSWCLGDSAANCVKYGRLYDWETAIGICPDGWHVPAREEWGDLAVFAGGSGVYGDTGTAAVKLKSKNGWLHGANGTDDFRFSALPGGHRNANTGFKNDGRGGWWTATEIDGAQAYRREMISKDENDVSINVESVIEYATVKEHAFSVRCVEGIAPPPPPPPPEEDSTFTDGRDGQVYKKVKINGQTWMAQNLNHDTEDGKSWCLMDSPDSCAKYGMLYNWESATAVCPTGWRLPTREEWGDLAVFAGGSGVYGDTGTAAVKLKSKNGWLHGANGTDDYKFSALPGGHRHNDNGFVIDGRGMWWTSTEGEYSNKAYRREMISTDDIVYEYSSDKVHAFSVRCVENSSAAR